MHLGRGVSTELTVMNALVYSKTIVSVADFIIAHACNSYIYFFCFFPQNNLTSGTILSTVNAGCSKISFQRNEM